MKTNKNLNYYIKVCKKLIDRPYNKFNLGNYRGIMASEYDTPVYSYPTKSDSPIKLMAGQHREAQIISTDYQFKHNKRRIILVGKGILFDSGGYNLKPKMVNMKSDMAGMAVSFAVASYFKKQNDVIAFCPVATNFLDGNQIIPGDEIKIGNKIVKITNTDAEGRLILAEALSELKVKPTDIVITVATLTGVVGYAIGDKATGVFSPNKRLANKYLEASKKAKELAWELPLWDYLQKHFDKKKIKNVQKINPGASMGAMFLKQFVRYPQNWLHLDIAYSAWDKKKEKATGEPIKSLVQFIERIGQ